MSEEEIEEDYQRIIDLELKDLEFNHPFFQKKFLLALEKKQKKQKKCLLKFFVISFIVTLLGIPLTVMRFKYNDDTMKIFGLLMNLQIIFFSSYD